jgi:hypothetical protein
MAVVCVLKAETLAINVSLAERMQMLVADSVVTDETTLNKLNGDRVVEVVAANTCDASVSCSVLIRSLRGDVCFKERGGEK